MSHKTVIKTNNNNYNDNYKPKSVTVQGLKDAILEANFNSSIEEDDYIYIKSLFEIIDDLELKELPIGD